MSKTNGHSNLFPPSNSTSDESELPLTRGGIGEVKEALGRLYKKVNDLEISEKAEREQNRAELKAWAQTNLIQTQLLSKQTAVIELLTQELKNKENSSQQSELLSETLLQELMLLKNQLSSIPKSSPKTENLDLKGLKNEVSALKTIIRPFPTKLNEITKNQTNIVTRLSTLEIQTISSPKDLDSDDSSWGKAWKNALAFLILFFVLSGIGSRIFPPRTPDETLGYIQSIWERTGWTNTKLQRLERRFGTAPKHQK